MVDKVIEVKDKKIKTYLGDTSYYLMKKAEEKIVLSNPGQSIPAKKSGSSKDNYKKGIELKNKKKEINKIIAPVKKKVSEIEEDVKKHESVIKEMENKMSSPEFYEDADEVKRITKEYNDAKEKLDRIYENWERESSRLTELQKELSIN